MSVRLREIESSGSHRTAHACECKLQSLQNRMIICTILIHIERTNTSADYKTVLVVQRGHESVLLNLVEHFPSTIQPGQNETSNHPLKLKCKVYAGRVSILPATECS